MRAIFALAGGVEQAQVDADRMRGVDGDIDAVAVDVRAEGPGPSGLDRRPQAIHSKMTVASGGTVN